MSARLALRLALAVAIVAMSGSLSGCVFLSSDFWECQASAWTNTEACGAYLATMHGVADDWDGDGVENGEDECVTTRGNRQGEACPDDDGDTIPDYRDPCPLSSGFPTGCPPGQSSPPGDVMPPPAPSGLTAVGQGSRIRLDWDDVSNVPDLAGYHVQRSPTSGGPYTQITTAGPVTASTYDDTAIDPAQTYYYVVVAVDTSGNQSAPSAEVSAIGCQPPECTGSGPGGLSRSATGSAHISLATARKPYRATVRGRFERARSFRARDGIVNGRALVFTGRLAAAPGAPAGLRRAAWTARMDLSISTQARRATARGVALARFGRRSEICLRFTQLMRVGGGGERLLGGSFKVIGATGKARRLASASRFSGAAGRGGAWTLRASGKPGRRVPGALPRACRGLG